MIGDRIVRDSLANHEVDERLAACVVDVVGDGLTGRKADVAAGVKGEEGASALGQKRGSWPYGSLAIVLPSCYIVFV
jgi:hypothetical protein